jgi:cytochrome c oxidase subunit 4
MATTEHAHPTPRQYWLIGVILAVVTAVEVAASYWDALGGWVVPILLSLAAVKFAIVARWYMHLKFDKPIYSRFFVVGIAGAIILFTVVLLTFGLLVGT